MNMSETSRLFIAPLATGHLHNNMAYQHETDEFSDAMTDDLSLSCGSSDFEAGEDISSVESGNDQDSTPERQTRQNILPYQFEPYISTSEDSQTEQDEDSLPNENRMNDNSW